MGVVKSSHCVYSAHYHVVFPVKYRRALLDAPIVATLKQVTKELEERYELVIERLGADQDHIHILYYLPNTTARPCSAGSNCSRTGTWRRTERATGRRLM